MKIHTIALVMVFSASAFSAGVCRAEIRADNLRCEYRVDPLGIDSRTPRLSWIILSDRRAEIQTAYRVLAASSAELLAKGRGDLWDSGKIESDRQNQVEYAGKPLESRMRCYWKVRTWDKAGAPSAWSNGATWTMGLLTPRDWKAQWIGAAATPEQGPSEGDDGLKPSAAIQLRKEFALEKAVKQAFVYVCGLGFYELRLNGQKVGDRLLDPGWTNYRRTCLYATYDVTAELARGPNALGVILGNGMYNVPGGRYVKFTGTFGPPKVILQLYVEYADGTSTLVVTDPSWKWSPSPVVFNCIYGGEDYDARRETSGWDKSGFNDQGFRRVAVVDGPGGRLASQGRRRSR